MTDANLERLHRKQDLLTTLVLFLVVVEIARLFGRWFSWNLLESWPVAVFLTAIAWFLASLTA